MDVVKVALDAVLPKLGDLLTGEFRLQTNVREEVISLTAELECMQAALRKMSQAPIDQPPDDQNKLWAKDVRELSYDVDDCVDKFMVRIDTHEPEQLHGLMGFVNRGVSLLKRAKICHDIGADINGIKRRIKEVSERRVRYKIDHAAAKQPAMPTVDSLRLSALYEKATELVGTEETSDHLIKLINGHDEAPGQQPLKVVSIVGFGGLGKTTLAKIVVYDKLKGQFDCGAFVSMSLTPDVDNIFKNMLRQLGNHNCEAAWNGAQLINELRDFLRQKRFFVVIDDIWDISVWKTIQYAFNDNDCASRIITTTRILEVAKKASCVYELKPLSLADSRKLFYLRICGNDNKYLMKELSDVSENILKKCGGVPLAIITIASMLASKRGMENSHEYWSKVYESMGSGLQDSRYIEDMRRILSLSYYDLPPHLRICLLYLSSYPEDCDIIIQNLIWKWVSEGFVPKVQGKTMYEVGEDYVEELINRSLIQPLYIYSKTKASHCRVHDMVLDLITWLSNAEQFLTKLGPQTKSLPNKIWRLCISTSKGEDIKQLAAISLSRVRSLKVLNRAFKFLPVLATFPLVRVLDLNGCVQVRNHHFKDICNMFHLRYLRLCKTSITEVPKEIGNLKFLQVLDIGRNKIEELPASFIQLQQLLYMRIEKVGGIPEGFENLKSLQILIGLIHMKSPTMLISLGGLTELRGLHLIFDEAWNESYGKAFCQLLSSMVNLKQIWISGKANIDLASECDTDNLLIGPQLLRQIRVYNTIPSVPRWISSLCSLSILHITLQKMGEEDDLQLLGIIQCLSELSITVEGSTQGRDNKLVISNVYPFLCLSKLEIYGDIMEVMFAPGAMQNLQTIELEFDVHKTMAQFGDVDFFLENLSSLHHVFVYMFCPLGNSEDMEAAEAAIQKTVDMNPNKPSLYLHKTYVLKMEIHGEGNQRKASDILYEIGAFHIICPYGKQGMVRAFGHVPVSLTTIMKKLRKASVPAALWAIRA